MKPRILLRSAAILTLIHAVLHTFGGLLSEPSHGPEEIAVLNTMKSLQFDFMGSPRTYWDFYFGFGLFLTVSLLLQAVLLWQLASLAKSDPAKASPFIAALLVAFIAAVVLSWRFFFIAPLVMEVIIAILIGLAYVLTKPRGAA
jgi:hypothetical protein